LARSDSGFRPSRRRRFAAPLTIGVLSDTHIYPRGARRLPPEVLDLFTRFGVGLILHAGDVNTVSVLAELAMVAPVIAVTGNNDDADLREVIPESVEFRVGRYSFAMLHGHGGQTARSEARRRFAGKVDCIVYGHSHIPLIERVGETILFNPGSATDRRWGDHFGVGLIHVTASGIEPELVLYQDPRHLRNIRLSPPLSRSGSGG
jgi:putative phosphoesterase